MNTYFLQRATKGASVGYAQPIPEKMLAKLAVETTGGGYTVKSTQQAMLAQSRMTDGTWSYQHPRTKAAYAIAACKA